MADIAKAAGVSRQAVYLHFGTRGGMLMALVKRADRRFTIEEDLFASFNVADAEARLEASLDVWFAFVRRIAPVAQELIRLRDTDPDASAAWEDRMAVLRSWLRVLVQSLKTDGALARGWSVETASEYLWAASSVQFWALLVRDCGWQESQAEKTIQRTVSAAILKR